MMVDHILFAISATMFLAAAFLWTRRHRWPSSSLPAYFIILFTPWATNNNGSLDRRVFRNGPLALSLAAATIVMLLVGALIA